MLQHGIRLTNLKQLWISAMVPGQVKCLEHDKPAINWQRSVHLFGGLSVGFSLISSLRASPALVSFLCSYAFLETEFFALLTSSLVLLLDIPAHVSQCCLDALDLWTSDPQYCMSVILPYGNIYFSSSSREFWSRWSRPAGQVMRYMIYYPLGGSARPYIYIHSGHVCKQFQRSLRSQLCLGAGLRLCWLVGRVCDARCSGNH
jgi:hypothetical protein